MRNNKLERMGWVLAVLALLAVPASCGKDDDAGSGEVATDGDEFKEAVPDTEQLALGMKETAAGETALTLATTEQALATDPTTIQARAQEIVDQVQASLVHAKAVLAEVFADSEPVISAENANCRIWEADGPKNHWRMTICAKNRAIKHFGYKVEGRPLASASDDDYKLVLAGEGKAWPRIDGKKRGVGRIGCDFDNLNELKGEGPTGKLGYAYRHVGKYRQLNIGMKDFLAVGAAQSVDALYKFAHLRGKGGWLRFVVNADFVKKEGDKLVRGTDGMSELGRAALGWTREGHARAVAAICGGTVGDNTCVRYRECWRSSGETSFDEVLAEGATPDPWSNAKCPGDLLLPVPVDEPPAEGDLQVPAEDAAEEIPGPAMEEPTEDAAAEGE